MMLDDTIAAIATPLGEGGLAVIRLSGPGALALADRSFVPVGKSSLRPSVAPTHTIQYGRIERQRRSIVEDRRNLHLLGELEDTARHQTMATIGGRRVRDADEAVLIGQPVRQ